MRQFSGCAWPAPAIRLSAGPNGALRHGQPAESSHLKRARADEYPESSMTGTYLAPIVDGEIDAGEDGIGTAFVKALVIVDGRERGKRFGHVLPCLSRAPRRRHDHSIGEESVMRHIGPNLG